MQDSLYQLPYASLDAPRDDLLVNGNYQYGAGINLRSLGVGATLVLVNGRRQPPSGYLGEFVDESAIPWSAVDRIEVFPDGASTVFGADAIGGIVNFVMRNDFQGAQTQLRFGGSPDWGAVSQLFGTQWSRGKAMLAYEYSDAMALAAASRAYAADADKRPFGGEDYRSVYSDPGNLFNPATPGQLYAISAGQIGVARPIGTIPSSNEVNLENPFAQYEIFPHRVSHSVYVSATQEVLDSLELFSEARFTRRDVHATAYFAHVGPGFHRMPAGISQPCRSRISRHAGPS